MAEKSDWHIWKADGKHLLLKTTVRPHDGHVESTTPAECRATVYSVTEQVADRIMAVLSDRKCPNCRGEGEYMADPQDIEKTPCYQCRGTGKGY